MLTFASARFRHHCSEMLVAEFALNDSSAPFCQGFARIDEAGLNLRGVQPAQDGGRHEFRPLSERRNSGAPCTLTSFLQTSIMRPDRMPPQCRSPRHSRVKLVVNAPQGLQDPAVGAGVEYEPRRPTRGSPPSVLMND